LPSDAEPLGAWKLPSYAPDYQRELLALLEDISALRAHPLFQDMQADYAEAQREGTAWSAPDWTEQLDIWQRIEALKDPQLAKRLRGMATALLDPSLGFGGISSALLDLKDFTERVREGEPYEKHWADARPDLARFENDSGLLARPSTAPGMVEIYALGSDRPPLVLPLPIVRLLAEHPEAALNFAVLANKMRAGEDYSAELRFFEQRLVRLLPGNDEFGNPWERQDRSAFNEAKAAIEGAAARLAEGAPPDEVFLNLAQVVLAEELDDTDLVLETVRTVLEFAPYYDLVDLGVNTVALLEAIDAGDWDAATAAGLGMVLAAVGAVPFVGDVAKTALTWFGRKVGLIQGPYERARAKLLASHTHDAWDMGGVIGQTTEDLLLSLYGKGGDLQNKQFLERFLDKARITGPKRDQISHIFEIQIIPKAAELELRDALSTFVSGTGFRLVPNKRPVKSGYGVDKSKPDYLIVPDRLSDEELEKIYQQAAEEIQHTPFAIFDAKTGQNGASRNQALLAERLNRAGSLDVFLFYNLPQEKVSASALTDALAEYMEKAGQKLTQEDRVLVELLAKTVKRSLLGGAPAYHAFGLVLLGASIALGLTYTLSQGESNAD
jgi:hypothetical protein